MLTKNRRLIMNTTHLEKQRQVTRKSGKHKARIRIQRKNAGDRVQVHFTHGPLAGKRKEYSVKKLLTVFPSLNPKKILQHSVSLVS